MLKFLIYTNKTVKYNILNLFFFFLLCLNLLSLNFNMFYFIVIYFIYLFFIVQSTKFNFNDSSLILKYFFSLNSDFYFLFFNFIYKKLKFFLLFFFSFFRKINYFNFK